MRIGGGAPIKIPQGFDNDKGLEADGLQPDGVQPEGRQQPGDGAGVDGIEDGLAAGNPAQVGGGLGPAGGGGVGGAQDVGEAGGLPSEQAQAPGLDPFEKMEKAYEAAAGDMDRGLEAKGQLGTGDVDNLATPDAAPEVGGLSKGLSNNPVGEAEPGAEAGDSPEGGTEMSMPDLMKGRDDWEDDTWLAGKPDTQVMDEVMAAAKMQMKQELREQQKMEREEVAEVSMDADVGASSD